MSETTTKNKKRKIFSAVTAVVLSLAIMASATLAWTSISQTALNEIQGDGTGTPGGRLHDDFNGENKDVYVENFTDADDGGVAIYARIRLDEYMEIGTGAGLKEGDEGYSEKTAVSLVDGADINDMTTWTTHVPDDETDLFHEFWTWAFGGSTTYMPTFNKNKDSLEADINGTYANNFEDYVEYELGEQVTGNAVYDADDNDIDEGAAAVEGVNITTVEETHTAQSTLTATVITMAEWQAMGSPIGPYWVYDTDGWAYWAQPIDPGTATGLLLDSIQLTIEMEKDWYYAINVVAQFATAGDWGSADSGDGFFGSDAGASPTDDAIELLNKIAWKDILAKITPGSTDTVTIDGREWYVLANEGTKYLLWAKEIESAFSDAFDGEAGVEDSGDNVWETSTARTWLNDTYLTSTLTTLSEYAIETEITTREEYDVDAWITTTDTVFLLSEADLYGTHNGIATEYAQDYTYNGIQLVTNEELLICDSSVANHYWLRSPRHNPLHVTCVDSATGSINNAVYYDAATHGVRPALWIDLAS